MIKGTYIWGIIIKYCVIHCKRNTQHVQVFCVEKLFIYIRVRATCHWLSAVSMIFTFNWYLYRYPINHFTKPWCNTCYGHLDVITSTISHVTKAFSKTIWLWNIYCNVMWSIFQSTVSMSPSSRLSSQVVSYYHHDDWDSNKTCFIIICTNAR